MGATTVMVVEDDQAFLGRFCRFVAQSDELCLLAAVGDLALRLPKARGAFARRGGP
jgi:hypothetical protein